jgi:hypothetical protein
MDKQEIRAKALELAILIKGNTQTLVNTHNASFIISQYEPLAKAIEYYISVDVTPQIP